MTAAAAPCTVLVVGHVTIDRYGPSLAVGGSAYYAARTYLGLGASVRVATAAASDFPRDALRGAEVDVSPCARTTAFSNMYAADGTRTQRVEACAPALDPARVPASWAGPDVLHLAPVLAEIDLGRWVRAARACFVGIGVQGWVRALAPDGSVQQPRWAFEPRDLAGVHAACVGQDDLRGQGDLIERLVAVVPIVVVTHGERGCDVIAGGRTLRVGCYRTREVEPTGAGDVFAAALFLALARGAEPAEAARLGAAAASIVVEARAGEALDRIQEAWARVADVAVIA